jgi:hypothetical protein
LGLHLPGIVVLLQRTLVKLQRLTRSQGAKDGYITPKACLSPVWGEVFFAFDFLSEQRHFNASP